MTTSLLKGVDFTTSADVASFRYIIVANAPNITTQSQRYQIPLGFTDLVPESKIRVHVYKNQPNATIACVLNQTIVASGFTFTPPLVTDAGSFWSIAFDEVTGSSAPKAMIIEFNTNIARAELYPDVNYVGTMRSITADTPNIGASHGFNDIASSMWVPPFTKVSLFEHVNYGGGIWVANNYSPSWSGFPDFRTNGWNDRVSSVKVTYATP